MVCANYNFSAILEWPCRKWTRFLFFWGREMSPWDFIDENVWVLNSIMYFCCCCFVLLFFLLCLSKATRIVWVLPVDVFISVSVTFACIKSLEFPYYVGSPWLSDWEGKCEFNSFCTFKSWAGDKWEDLEFVRISRVPLERNNGVLVPFNSNAGLELTWVSEIENCQKLFCCCFSSGAWNKLGLSPNRHACNFS